MRLIDGDALYKLVEENYENCGVIKGNFLKDIDCAKTYTLSDLTHDGDKEVISMDRLREICNAEREGRCVTPKLKYGDTVYAVFLNEVDAVVHEYKIQSVKVLNGTVVYETNNGRHNYHFEEKRIGRSVFLTRADAEAALEVQG